MSRTFDRLTAALDAEGLQCLGQFHLDEGECLIPDRPVQPSTIAIVGNVGSALWPVFKTARLKRPGLDLDQWTKKTIDRIAMDFGVAALYPFEGPPYWPFTRWAKRTGSLFASPLGLTIHPVFGLWHAFRAALLFDEPLDGPVEPAERPCDRCRDRPCLETCPVGAFTENGYDFEVCLDHVAIADNACRQRGCLARAACPVGQEFRYIDDHAAFHMAQLLKAHGRL